MIGRSTNTNSNRTFTVCISYINTRKSIQTCSRKRTINCLNIIISSPLVSVSICLVNSQFTTKSRFTWCSSLGRASNQLSISIKIKCLSRIRSIGSEDISYLSRCIIICYIPIFIGWNTSYTSVIASWISKVKIYLLTVYISNFLIRCSYKRSIK